MGAPWYDAEVQAAEKLGITHIDFGMSARRELDETQVKHIIGLLETAEKPILIHCNGGADRSGLVAALCVAAVARKGETEAESPLSVRYGHVRLWFLPEQAMDRTWEAVEDHLGFGGS